MNKTHWKTFKSGNRVRFWPPTRKFYRSLTQVCPSGHPSPAENNQNSAGNAGELGVLMPKFNHSFAKNRSRSNSYYYIHLLLPVVIAATVVTSRPPLYGFCGGATDVLGGAADRRHCGGCRGHAAGAAAAATGPVNAQIEDLALYLYALQIHC